jgi:deoxycytidylate deaminase
MSGKFDRILNRLRPLAENHNENNFCHVAVLIKAGKVISCGYNSMRGNISLHAERDAIYKYLSIIGISLSLNNTRCMKKIQRTMSSISILVIRWKGDAFRYSKPCSCCVSILKTVGIRKVYYSNNEGDIEIDKTDEICTNHLSTYYRQTKGIRK